MMLVGFGRPGQQLDVWWVPEDRLGIIAERFGDELRIRDWVTKLCKVIDGFREVLDANYDGMEGSAPGGKFAVIEAVASLLRTLSSAVKATARSLIGPSGSGTA